MSVMFATHDLAMRDQDRLVSRKRCALVCQIVGKTSRVQELPARSLLSVFGSYISMQLLTPSCRWLCDSALVRSGKWATQSGGESLVFFTLFWKPVILKILIVANGFLIFVILFLILAVGFPTHIVTV